ncbi:MAG: XRE family transcriptional regulator [Sneathiella sp.]|jgi:hypothetical protein|uniref:MbcA/ParS/Xre antitoxin family protein n=1 Tax=Sneathiella sp. TaxID=1964365 RepID=UPI000C683904|nr:MbcA/ParS/Xre antitoxin family protein [Sneathiella sp.]MAL79302.1 XRE family transcriptional regulator [Sneathiella sp.]|tara:strand:+ start:277 stop:636 length:360 start_codon:yes stop_codon:yes gene_type:complete
MLATKEIPELDRGDVLGKAARNAAAALGLTRAELGEIIGRDRTSLNKGIRPSSKSGQLALLFVRCYRGLYALLGGDRANMSHWFRTENRHLRGTPKDLVKNVEGLVTVLRYLDGMRGKI